MDIRIGIQHAPRELVIETEESAESVQAALETALGDGSIATLKDSKGGTVLVPGAKIAYAEISSPTQKRVGFLG
ncbi:DUF3107 domain-containing protein [Brachybacterium halotolerans subsp. kimchii]|jgi:hypothetical protein|uniref:DUF3107 domain-containing protein n=2 Tax=Brachybacterium TaxID=43668 RepID=A0ABS1B750_9MICO|nr:MULTISPECIES: DUF3107 domain-containing protein [Brachybacterium]MBK0330463.1 DUF3107 domain-containing protein [Brachybacterium halotolerans]MCG7308456.1 DUF3107 domain-containing protein [Brachybacterium sp. ACRRE]UEJ83599.1 DUF3107 domain-containing protein [Brachybacterium halotolerans subsp. kimchii]UQN31192.1 DUF3107 domain-containing protein [Brachybacterium kimchii]